MDCTLAEKVQDMLAELSAPQWMACVLQNRSWHCISHCNKKDGPLVRPLFIRLVVVTAVHNARVHVHSRSAHLIRNHNGRRHSHRRLPDHAEGS